jgi:hypothetical protein
MQKKITPRFCFAGQQGRQKCAPRLFTRLMRFAV